MATKRKVTKKNIRKDPLLTYALKVSGYTREHYTQIIVGIAVIIAIIAAAGLMSNNRRNNEFESARQLTQATALYQQGDFESAKVILGQIIDRSGGRHGALARYYKAECELSQRNYSQALLDYESYFDHSSNFPDFETASLYGQSICHEGLENYKRAAEIMEQIHSTVEENDPRYLDSAFKAGELYKKLGDFELAAKYFQTVSDNASGVLKDKAAVLVTLLDLQ